MREQKIRSSSIKSHVEDPSKSRYLRGGLGGCWLSEAGRGGGGGVEEMEGERDLTDKSGQQC